MMCLADMPYTGDAEFICDDCRKTADVQDAVQTKKTDGRTSPFYLAECSRSPIIYVGGKSFAVDYILSLVPQGRDIMSPFVGGGSIELALSCRGQAVSAYDAFRPLVLFWQGVTEHGGAAVAQVSGPIIDDVTGLDALKKVRNQIRELASQQQPDTLLCAALYHVVNVCSFSGTGFASGFSKRRKEQSSYSVRYMDIFRMPDLLDVRLGHFRDSIPQHKGDFIYADPPYDLKTNNLYGYSGQLHKEFSHEEFAQVLLSHTGGFILSYNDTPRIRALYSGYPIIPLRKNNGMVVSSNDSQSEIIIDGRNR